MGDKRYTVTLDDLIDHFLPTPPASSTKSIPNLFANVPTFETEREMYHHFTSVFDESSVFPGQTFITTAWKSDTGDTIRQAIDCGEEPTGTDGSRIDLCIECKLHSTKQDPFDETEPEDHYEAYNRRQLLNRIHARADLVFRHQHRTFHYMLLLFRECARVIRFDHSSMVVTEKVRYDTGGEQLSHVLARLYGRRTGSLVSENWGHDPTAVRIETTNELHARVHEYAEKSVSMDPNDYAAGLFKASLVDSWPIWKLKVHDEETETDHWFAVGKPHFQAHAGVAGRGTRGYVALPLDDDTQLPSFDGKGRPTKRYVYLKDAWRTDHPSLQKEGLVLNALNRVKVPYVPTVVFHGDLRGHTQTTLSYDVWKGIRGEDEQCPLKPHRHYRLVVKEVGKPLHEFGRGLDFVVAILDVILAHEQARKAGYIHRDISPGNILLYRGQDSDGRWEAMLNDREMAAAYPYPYPATDKSNSEGSTSTSAGFQVPAPERPGTWQFLSVNCLLSLSRRKPGEIADDLESIFHVLLYLAVRFLPYNITDDEAVRVFVHRYFDDCSPRLDGTAACSHAKYDAVLQGRILLTLLPGCARFVNGVVCQEALEFYQYAPAEPAGGDSLPVPPALHPIDGLVSALLQSLKEFYALGRRGEFSEENAPPRENTNPNDSDSDSDSVVVDLRDWTGRDDPDTQALIDAAEAERAAAARRAKAPPPAGSTRKVPVDRAAVRAKMTHDAFVKVFGDCLRGFGWPEEDKGHDKLGPKTQAGRESTAKNWSVGTDSDVELETSRGTSMATTAAAASTTCSH